MIKITTKRTEYNKAWEEKQDKDYINYLKSRSAAKSFIRMKATKQDITMLRNLIDEREYDLNMEGIGMLPLNDKVYFESIVKVLKKEGINNIFDFMDRSELKETTGCSNCMNGEVYILDLSNKFGYNQDIEEFYEIDEENEDCIEDFVIYFCPECRKKEYYIQL